jgi:serine phosphatase RsbU (regulator of sigma subunit)
MGSLVALGGEIAGRRFSCATPCLVGRGPYNHVVLDDTRVSRQHAKISPEPGGHVVYDLNSANGTFVNDVQIKRQKLRPQDIVRFGPFSFRFEAEVQERTGPHQPVKFRDIMTQVGAEPPSKIIDSLDVSPSSPTRPSGTYSQQGLLELEDADRKLRTLYSFMQSIATTLEQGELVSRILKNLLEVFPTADTVAIYLRDPQSGLIEPRSVIPRDDRREPALSMLPPQFYEEIVSKGHAILSAPLSPDKKATGLQMHAPIIFNGEVQGVLHARGADGQRRAFTQSDLDLLTGLSAQAAMALSNARMHVESLKQQRLQQDLLLAEQIQKSFLPHEVPKVEGIEFVTDYRPAYSVGGDFYDLFWIDSDRIGVFIGDVSGKGVSAALLMARISSDLRVAALARGEPKLALAAVNRIVLERRQHDIFVTGIYLILDVKKKQVTLANAGHLPPFIRHDKPGELERVDGGSGTAIGLFDEAVYEQVTLQLEDGDSLVLCTDGVLEAVDERGEQFGFPRLEQSLSTGASRPRELCERLERDLRAHVGDAPQSDDLTLIVLGVNVQSARRRRDEPTQDNIRLDQK